MYMRTSRIACPIEPESIAAGITFADKNHLLHATHFPFKSLVIGNTPGNLLSASLVLFTRRKYAPSALYARPNGAWPLALCTCTYSIESGKRGGGEGVKLGDSSNGGRPRVNNWRKDDTDLVDGVIDLADEAACIW